MNIRDYKEKLKSDLLQFAEDSRGYVENLEKFEDEAFFSESVTGNASGSYTFNAHQAEENIKDLIFSDELLDMFKEFGYDRVPLEKGAEYIDVSIRCFLVNQVIYENEDEIKEILDI